MIAREQRNMVGDWANDKKLDVKAALPKPNAMPRDFYRVVLEGRLSRVNRT